MIAFLLVGLIGAHVWVITDDLADAAHKKTVEYVARNCEETNRRIVVEGEIRTVYQCDRPDYLDLK